MIGGYALDINRIFIAVVKDSRMDNGRSHEVFAMDWLCRYHRDSEDITGYCFFSSQT
jgi:hypothetical protein